MFISAVIVLFKDSAPFSLLFSFTRRDLGGPVLASGDLKASSVPRRSSSDGSKFERYYDRDEALDCEHSALKGPCVSYRGFLGSYVGKHTVPLV